MANLNFIASSAPYGWAQSLSASGKYPLISKRLWKTYADMIEFVGDTTDTCVSGVILTVTNDSDSKKNGAYFVASCPTLENPNLPVKVQKIGSGETLTAETYDAAVLLATDNNIGSTIYVKEDSEEKGLYVIVGNKLINKLVEAGSLESTLDDVSSLKTDVELLKGGEEIEGSIAYELKPIKNKLNTIEENAQVNVLEKVYVNNQELQITNKSVYLDVPEIVNNLTTDDSTKALSAAQGKLLSEQVAGVQQKLVNVYTYKGSKNTYAELPTDAVAGDVWNVAEKYENHSAGTNYAWTGTEWDALAGSIDLSNYYIKTEVDNAINTAVAPISGLTERVQTVENLIGVPTTDKDRTSTMLSRLNALEGLITGGEGGEGEDDQTLLQKVTQNTLAIAALNTTVYGADNKSGLVEAVNSLNGAVNILNGDAETVGSVDYKIDQAFKWNEVN